jgi:ankyrin repeat protein
MRFSRATGEIVELLLKFRARADDRDSKERTPLFQAASSNNTVVLKALLSPGMVASDAMDKHETPISRAARKCSAEAVEILLPYSNKINALSTKSLYEYPPLITAIKSRHWVVAKALLQSDPIDPDAIGKHDETALYEAQRAGQSELV